MNAGWLLSAGTMRILHRSEVRYWGQRGNLLSPQGLEHLLMKAVVRGLLSTGNTTSTFHLQTFPPPNSPRRKGMQHELAARAQNWEMGDLGLISGSAADLLRDHGQATAPLCLSFPQQ